MSQETKDKLSEALKGKVAWNKGLHTGIKTKGTTGFKFSNESKEKVSKSLIGNKRANNNRNRLGKSHSEETKAKIKEKLKGNIPWNKGKKMAPFSEEWRQKQSERKGENSANWKGGITPENHRIRTSKEMSNWKRTCMERDNFTCQKTGIRGGKLVIHHINNFAKFPELRTCVENGITLSAEAHREFHKIYGNKHNTREQLEEFLKN